MTVHPRTPERPRDDTAAEVVAESPRHAAVASAWAAKLGLPWRVEDAANAGATATRRATDVVHLEVGDRGLALRAGDGPAIRVDVLELLRSRRRGKDLLGRAVGREARTVVDATAGLGRDGVHLASIGKQVTLVERVPLVAALVEDALARATRSFARATAAPLERGASETNGTVPDQTDTGGAATGATATGATATEAVSRLRLVTGDARSYLRGLAAAGEELPDVVLLDPMYPGRGKSALPGKGMALFRALVGDDSDAPGLLATAIEVARRRVVVKRPASAPPLDGPLPTGAVRGKTTRYDIYAPRPAHVGARSLRSTKR